MTQKTDSQKGSMNMVLIFLVAILLISNLLAIYYLYLKNQEKQQPQKIIIQNTEEPIVDNHVLNNNNKKTQTAQDFLNNQRETANEEPEEDTQNVETPEKDITEENLKEEEILVEWNQWPVAANYYSLFDYDDIEQKIKDYNKTNNNEDATTAILDDLEFYKTGKIKQGTYIGKNLYIITFRPEGPAFRDEMYRVIENDKNPILLSKYSDTPWGIYEKIFVQNDKIQIANLEPPAVIKIPNSEYNLIKKTEEPFLMMENIDNPLKLFKYDEENYIYKDVQKNCFIVKANDGTVREYNFQLDFIGKKGEENQYVSIIPYLLNITWIDGSKNKNEYAFQMIGGCGIRGCYNYSDYISGINQLEKVGEFNNGDAVYELKDDVAITVDADGATLTEVYNHIYNSYLFYSFGYDAGAVASGKNVAYSQEILKKVSEFSFEKFLANHPIIYWQDPFGDFIEFRNAEYTPPVECGKPVIYLYPEKQTDISVLVKPTGGFSITEPAYNNGWKVSASPNSEIYNYGDQKIYPYLFWEGTGINYIRPKEGFVVKKENVKEFLEEKLAKLGLIKKEYDEFIEFWLPKMQDRNYYFATFVPQPQFDLLAPLTVDPKPDTVIRVFMDYEGLDEYIEVKEQKFFTPHRKGFTVVEWGGALHN